LEEQDKTHPLIVFVVDAWLSRSVLINPWMRDFLANSFVVSMRKSKCGMNPTIGVYNIRRYVIALNTIDGVSKVLTTSYEEGEGDEEDHGCLIVEAENVVVDAYLVYFD
jgi:hypothetical protein